MSPTDDKRSVRTTDCDIIICRLTRHGLAVAFTFCSDDKRSFRFVGGCLCGIAGQACTSGPVKLGAGESRVPVQLLRVVAGGRGWRNCHTIGLPQHSNVLLYFWPVRVMLSWTWCPWRYRCECGYWCYSHCVEFRVGSLILQSRITV